MAALVYAPSEVNMKVANGIEVGIKEETNYPFDETVSFSFSFAEKKVKSADFPFHLRVPKWCKKPIVKINGMPVEATSFRDNIFVVKRQWTNNDKLTIEFPAEVTISHWYDNSAVVERGPLVYALKLTENWEKKTFTSEGEKNEYGEWYYEVTTDSPWNYVFMHDQLRADELKDNFVVEKRSLNQNYPWTLEEAPITIRTKARRIPSWTLNRGSVGTIPYFVQQYDHPDPEEYDIELIPYGCTTLRITEFPIR